MIAALLFVVPGRSAHSFSIPQPAHADVRGGMANLLTRSLTIRSIWGERFLSRHFSGYVDPLRAADLFRSFLKRFVLTTIDATCYSRARIHPELPRRLDLASFYVFQIGSCSQRTPNDKNAHMFVRSAAKWLVKLVAFCVFHFLRLCERVLPTSVLSLLLWPPAAAWDLLHLRQRTPLACWRRFPESWRPKRWRFVLRQSLGLYHAQLLYVWPDRLRTARWLSRCRLEGGSDLIGPWEGKRAVIGVTLHFGPVATLPYWLRAHGIALTTVRGPALDSLTDLTIYQFSLSPPADVPVFVSMSEIGSRPRLSNIRKVLGPSRRMGMTIDANRGKQFYVRFEDRLFRMATGAIRLAQILDAELIPVLIVETSTWKFTIHFGTPVPQHYLGNRPDMQAIGTHLLQEFSKVITRYPEQCNMRLLRAMFPLPENGVADVFAVVQAGETN